LHTAADVLMYKTTTEAEDEDVTSVVTDSTMSVQDQRHLEEKLHELQMKKQRMDQLLDELQALKVEREIHDSGQWLPCLQMSVFPSFNSRHVSCYDCLEDENSHRSIVP